MSIRSTASSALNAIALVVLEDFIKKKNPNLKDTTATAICKIVAFGFGMLITALAFIVKYVGTLILQLSYSIFGMVMSQLTGFFILGMFFPRANYKGAFAGGISGLSISFWIVLGSRFYPGNSRPGDVSVRGCPFFNATTANSTGIFTNQWKPHTGVPIANLYNISYLWLSTVSLTVFLTVALLVSIVTDIEHRHQMDPSLLFPTKQWLMSFLPGHKMEWGIVDGPPLTVSPREVNINNDEENLDGFTNADIDIGLDNEAVQVTRL